MDFVRSPKHSADPLVSRPVARPVVKQAPKPAKPVAKPAAKPVAKPAPKPAARPVTKVTKTTTVTTIDAAPVKPAPAPEPAAPVLGVIEDYESDSPDASKYILGGKSPFIASVSVEKRPLSDSIPEYHVRTTKNVYTKEKIIPEEPAAPVTIISNPPAKKSKAALVAIIILTIILGAAVGTIAYLLLPLK